MKDKITVIITIRNREASRIESCVNSIRKGGANPTFHIVDYGSDENYAAQYKDVCQKLEIQYTHMYSEGLPWNKCRAINYGARVATTPFIVTSDVDMIYEKNPFQWCLDNYKDKTMFNIPTYWLPKNGDYNKAVPAGTGSPGGYCFISANAYKAVNAYDERFVYWGLEDLDWPKRLKKIGYEQIWLPEEYKIYHKWHTKSENGYLRPYSATIDSCKYFFENEAEPILNNDWGKAITKDDRPILDMLTTVTPFEYTVPYSSMNTHFTQILECCKKNKFVRINLLQRKVQKPFQKMQSLVKKICTPFCHKTGLECEPEINTNFDFLYPLIPTYQKLGLKDYYISKDLNYVYMLWRE